MIISFVVPNSWQEGYAAFTYSKSQLTTVTLYIRNQQEHHQKHSFLSEYKQFLESYDIPYDEKYLFTELT
jgi:putative transposase